MTYLNHLIAVETDPLTRFRCMKDMFGYSQRGIEQFNRTMRDRTQARALVREHYEQVKSSQGQPFTTLDERLAEHLRSMGIDVTSFTVAFR